MSELLRRRKGLERGESSDRYKRIFPDSAGIENDFDMIKKAMNGGRLWSLQRIPRKERKKHAEPIAEQIPSMDHEDIYQKSLEAFEDLNDENCVSLKGKTFSSVKFDKIPSNEEKISVKVSQGQLYFSNEKFEKGDNVTVTTKKGSSQYSGIITSISHSEVSFF